MTAAQLLEKLQESDALVLDLDSTLFDVSKRMDQIMRDFALQSEFREKYPQQCLALEKIEHLSTDWGLEITLQKGGIDTSSQDFMADMMSFWTTHFFSNEYLQYDRPMPGALEFTQKAFEKETQIFYLTGRTVDRQLEGTEKSLRENGFPLDSGRAEMVLKPDPEVPDAPFKDQFFKKLRRHYEEIYFIDNEPVNMNHVLRSTPEIQLILFDSVHSGREEASPEIAKLKSFEMEKK